MWSISLLISFIIQIWKMKLCIIIIAFFNAPAVAVVSYCFYKNEDNMNMLRNQSCSTGQLHLNENWISTDYNSSQEAPSEADRTERQRSRVEMCVVFRYTVQQNLSSVVSSLSRRTTLSCDFRHWCSGRAVGFYPNETMEGQLGDLYCCDSNNCNMEVKVPQTPQICYKNLHHWNHHLFTPASSPYGSFTMCKDPESWCIRSRPLNSSRWMTAYDCDDQLLCQHFNMTSGSSLVCRNVTQAYGKEELCCCLGPNNCFLPALPWRRASASILGRPVSAEGRQRRRRPLESSLSTATVGCIVAFSLLGVVGGVVMVGLMYQRQSLGPLPPRAAGNSLTLTYSRIQDEDDLSDTVHML